jgi:23S rRNA (cytidine1920-2'-O)/16S rRNA (cytidine1409-2'-O)-methyltransferase
MDSMDRIDKILVDLDMLRTRSQAKMLIGQGCVYHNGVQVTKAGLKVNPEDNFEIKETNIFVSRGAYKLEKAINEFGLNLEGKVIADVGASTGGFTQVALDAKAIKVFAIDVGHDQLSPIFKDDPRVINLEGTNIKFPLELDEKVDLCVVDLSFISLKLVYKNIDALLKENGKSIVLIKPQFEAGRARLGKQGLVSEKDLPIILEEVKTWFEESGFSISKIMESPLKGNKSGNIEYLALIEK